MACFSHPNGETCADGGGISIGMFIALALASGALVYGLLFIRRNAVGPLLHRLAPVLAVVAAAAVVVLAYSWG
jgi:hypothetical protein